MVDLVIFDLDGVLVDACDWHRISLNDALLEVCGYEIPISEHYEIYNGIPTRKKLQMLTDRNLISREDHDEVYKLKQQRTVSNIKKYASIRNEKRDMLKELKARGIFTACYTNSIRETANLMLEKTGILDLFDFVLTNQDVREPKPSPEGYIFLMKHFNIDPKDVIIVEDSPRGLEAAHSSGARVFKVSDPGEVSIDLFLEVL